MFQDVCSEFLRRHDLFRWNRVRERGSIKCWLLPRSHRSRQLDNAIATYLPARLTIGTDTVESLDDFGMLRKTALFMF